MADTFDKDLLGFRRDPTDVGNPAQYLKVSDFVSEPDTTNADYYPNAHDPVQFGTSAGVGRYAGHPLFSGEGSLPPYAIVDARAKAFQHAAMAEQMRQEYRKQQRLNVTYNRPTDLPLAYNEDYQNLGKDVSMQMYGDAVKYYGGNQTRAAQDLQNPNGVFGKKYRDFNTNYQTYGSNVDEMNKITQGIRKQQVENKIIVPDAMEKNLQDFETGGFGKLDEHDPGELKQKFIQMRVMNNMLPAYNAFVKELTPTELPQQTVGRYKAKPGYMTVAVDPQVAKEEAMKVIGGGQKSAWALTLGLSPDASVDEIATALGESAVNKRSVQYRSLPEHSEHAGGWGNNEYTNERFAIRPSVKDEQGNMKIGSGYEIQDLAYGENSPKQVWKAGHALKGVGHERDKEFGGEVQGSLTGLTVATNPETKKLNWYAVITKPAVTSFDTKQEYQGMSTNRQSTPMVSPPETVLIPYDEVAGKIEAYTADKKGAQGFRLRKSDYDRLDEMNKKVGEGKTYKGVNGKTYRASDFSPDELKTLLENKKISQQ